MNWLKLAIRKYRTFWRLDGDSRWLLLQAFLLLPLVDLSLKFWGLKRTQAGLGKLLKIKEPGFFSQPDRQIIKTTRMVQLAARYCQPWANCLQKSLVLWCLLHRQGIESELRIGVKKEPGNFTAHAWVEYEGFVLNDSQNVRDRFAMFDSVIEVNLPL